MAIQWEHAQNHDAWAAIVKIKQETGWPRLYVKDLWQHDWARLTAWDAPKNFIWVTRETGTDFYDPNSAADHMWLQARLNTTGRDERIDGQRYLRYYLWREGKGMTELACGHDAQDWMRRLGPEQWKLDFDLAILKGKGTLMGDLHYTEEEAIWRISARLMAVAPLWEERAIKCPDYLDSVSKGVTEHATFI